jgi:hypothetical protein
MKNKIHGILHPSGFDDPAQMDIVGNLTNSRAKFQGKVPEQMISHAYPRSGRAWSKGWLISDDWEAARGNGYAALRFSLFLGMIWQPHAATI